MTINHMISWRVKPTASVAKPSSVESISGDGKKGALRFAFEYSMGRRFPCWLTCHFEGRRLPKVLIPYHVQGGDKGPKMCCKIDME